MTGTYAEVGYDGTDAITFTVVDGEGYIISVMDDNGCTEEVDRSDLVPCTKLPVELISFTGEAQAGGNFLTWITATEFDNDYFTLEHATDATNFSVIDVTAGAGTSIDVQTYDFLHTDAPEGLSYYRLSQTDVDGDKCSRCSYRYPRV